MTFSNVAALCIVVATAVTLNLKGITNIQTSAQAAEALRPIAGEFAFVVYALGIIDTSLLAVPVLAGSAAFAVSELYGWKDGLSKGFHEAKGKRQEGLSHHRGRKQVLVRSQAILSLTL